MSNNAVSLPAQGAENVGQIRSHEGSTSYPISLTLSRVSVDFLLLLAGTMAGGAVGHVLQRTTTFSLTPQQLLAGSLLYSALVLSLLAGENGYPRVISLLGLKETEIALRVSIKAIVGCLVLSIVARYPVPRMATLSAWVIGTLYLTIGRGWVQEAIAKRFAPDLPKRRTLIYGTKRTARRFFTGALHSPMLGIDAVGFLGNLHEIADEIYSNDYFQRDSRPVFREQLSVDMLKQMSIQEVVVCDSLSELDLNRVREVTQAANCSLSLVNNQEVLINRMPTWVWEMDGLFVATTSMSEPSRYYTVTKRIFDIISSAILITFSLPVWAILAIAVKLESKGPIFFRQTRTGQDGRPFEILKFRSMKVDAPKYARSPDEHNDPRITRVGRFLRRTSFDEVPQLINVLKGDMSMVGPRPEMPFITAEYGPLESTRLSVPQGITGLWQLSADRRYAIHQSLEYDLYYIQNRTVLMDLAILLHTLVYAAKGI
ncbi:MAG TPA: exopolysaccharide biosynthesis polyprenyl glycosylphosphotransferase [Terracidiphilus sp.]|jgi:exopolysaccharide biosynthesis polyprenyl glycosylphosphotransferase|nr:exopolysaccharide biosynthesis polyprenyl glycosylphosphotransferase [Terracidiphilus sp.]